MLLASATYPARSPDVNVADIKAQVAANEKGVQELRGVVGQYRLGRRARLYAPRHGQCRGERPPRDRPDRRRVASTTRWTTARRFASPSRSIAQARTATVDFTGTGGQRDDNFNAPPAVTRAAVLYVFRCLVGRRHPAERRLPEADHAGHPARHVPVARSRARRSSPATPRSRRPPAMRCSARSARWPAARRR